MEKFLNHINKYARIYWYILVVISLTIYIISNWLCAISFTFFSEFNGMNLLFIVWIILLILPCIGKFEGFGFKVETPFERLKKTADDIIARPNKNDIADIEKKLATVKKKGGK